MKNLLLVVFCCWVTSQSASADPARIAWQPWSDQAFEQARREHKLVLMDLEAVWCHWCHVQDETTYLDPHVIADIQQHYVAIKVDQDSRPDISNRYEDYGWPATIIFKADGSELVKFAGYIPPPRMRVLLEATVKDPTPGPSVLQATTPHYPSAGTLTDALRVATVNRWMARYDQKLGAWGDAQKFLDWDCVEYAMVRSRTTGTTDAPDPAVSDHMARQTLDAQLQIIDPVWGGVCQYSDGGVWTNPHYEKIMAMQANNLRIYSVAGSLYQEPRYRQAAQQIYGYMTHFLRADNGAFYTSQDADLVAGQHSDAYYALSDTERRKRGIPRIDKHQYARENGLAIRALAVYHDMSGDETALQQATQAAQWVLDNRGIAGGGFRHDAHDVGGPYLADTLSMGEAFLALYQSTGDRAWLDRATGAADFIAKNFQQANQPGYVTGVSHDKHNRLEPETDENLRLARWANLLYQDTGRANLQAMAVRAMRYMAAPEVASDSDSGSLLLTDDELGREPTHIAIVGQHGDAGQALYRTALTFPFLYRRLEWIDAQAGAPLRPDVEYPTLDRPAAFLCSAGRCSLPAFDPDALTHRFARLLTPAVPPSDQHP